VGYHTDWIIGAGPEMKPNETANFEWIATSDPWSLSLWVLARDPKVFVGKYRKAVFGMSCHAVGFAYRSDCEFLLCILLLSTFETCMGTANIFKKMIAVQVLDWLAGKGFDQWYNRAVYIDHKDCNYVKRNETTASLVS
jgi:hypothetical protein